MEHNLNVHITKLDSAVHSYEFERNLSVPIEIDVGQHRLLLYNNAKDPYISAFWIHENAHYVLAGELSIEEITEIVRSME